MISPLVVDLDGTLIKTDMLQESTLKVLRDNPLQFLKIPIYLSKGKAALKQHLASNTQIDPSVLPYNEELLSWLRSQREEGRHLILCSASDASQAHAISRHLGIFDDVIASDGQTNNAGVQKAQLLEQRFGTGGFDYVGNSSADLPVWSKARHAILANTNNRVRRSAESRGNCLKCFPTPPRGINTWRRTLRVHQWLKNLLLFVPLMASHQINSFNSWLFLCMAFFAFSVCASAVYIVNDLLDLESDRLHPRKRFRPFAAGEIPIFWGVLVAPVLLVTGFVAGSFVGMEFLSWLVFYFALTCLYSLKLKQIILIDCLTLAILYTLRIIAGTAASGLGFSFWLLGFSIFIFFSLALVKRYAEMSVGELSGELEVHGRGYQATDASLIQTMGIASGYLSALVLALYLNSDVIVQLYKSPGVVWGCVPLILFWVSWIWMQAHRGNMHDDPLVFAVKDLTSWLTGAIFAALVIIGATGLPW